MSNLKQKNSIKSLKNKILENTVLIMQNLGKNLRNLRKYENMTQDELKELSGVSKAQISRLERGNETNPTIQTLIALSTVLNSNLEELIFTNESQKSGLWRMVDEMEEDEKEQLTRLVKAFLLVNKS